MKRRKSTYHRHHEQVNIFLSHKVLAGANSHPAKASLKTKLKGLEEQMNYSQEKNFN